MKTQTQTRLVSIYRLAAGGAVLVAALAFSAPAQATSEAKAPVASAHAAAPKATEKVNAQNATDKVDARALKKRVELPREWVWKKDANSFDSMVRTNGR